MSEPELSPESAAPPSGSGAGWSRRAALAGIVSAAAAAGLLIARATGADAGSDSCSLKVVLRPGESLAAFVQAVEAEPGNARDRGTWVDELVAVVGARLSGRGLAEAGPLRLAHAVRAAIRADWAADRVVWVDAGCSRGVRWPWPSPPSSWTGHAEGPGCPGRAGRLSGHSDRHRCGRPHHRARAA